MGPSDSALADRNRAVNDGDEVWSVSGEFVHSRPESAADHQTRDVCPECGSESVRSDSVRAELVCQDCDCVFRTGLIDPGPEWSAFTHEEQQQNSRVGSPTTQLLHDKGLTTRIHWKDVDAQGTPLSPRRRRTMQRLRTWQKRVRTGESGERNLQLALNEINRMASALDLPEQVRDQASVIYRNALEDDLVQGRSIEGVACGCLYISCRKQGIARSLDEFEQIARVDRNEIASSYRCLVTEQNLAMAPIDPKQFVPRFCSKLAVSTAVQRHAIEILEDAKAQGLHSGKSPPGLAGAAIYIASILCEERLTQSAVAAVCDVTQFTIRNRYQEQLAVVDELDQQ